MKKLPYNITDKYTGIDFNPEGISKEEGYNCLSMMLAFCKEELDLDYKFEDVIVDDINWNNVVDTFNNNPNSTFDKIEKYFLNWFNIIAPDQMRKGDILVIKDNNRKIPCVFVGNNKILLTTTKGVKVIRLNGINVINVYRSRKEPRKITTKVTYQMSGIIGDYKLINDESYMHNGDVSECEAITAWIAANWVYLLISAIFSIIGFLLAPKFSYDTPQEEERGIKLNTRSSKETLKVVYGLQRVGGNDVYISTMGYHNKQLYIIQTLSEGECDSIYQVDGVDQMLVDDKSYTEFGDTIDYQFYSGSDTQTYDTVLNSVDSNWTDNLRYTSYIRWKFSWDEDQYRGVPSRILDFKGKKVLDFRDDTTAWSQNAVLCLYDFFTNGRYGLDVSTDKIDITSWTTAANYFDSKGWLFNYVIQNNNNPWAVAQDMMRHFRGCVSWFDGKYYLLISDINEESSVMTITDKHIVQDASGRAQIRLVQPNRFDKPKGLRCTFRDKEKEYIKDTVLIGNETGVVESISMMGFTDRKMVGDFATYQLERLKLNRSISGTFRDDCLELAPHDLVTFNSTALAISDQPMRVVSTSSGESGLIGLTLQYESEELYDDNYDADIEGTYTCDLPDPNTKTSISNPQISEQTFYYRLRTESRLHITFDVLETEPWFKHVEVWQAITTSGTVPDQSEYEHQFNIKDNFQLGPVEQGQTYYIVLTPVSIYNVKETFNNSPKLSHTVIGNSSAPQSLSYLSAIPSNSGLTLFSDKLEDPDIEVYEFRLGSQWSGGIFMSSKRSPQESLPGIKPGTFTFWCNPKGTNGVYGIDSQSATAKTQLPIGWSLSETFSDDYTGVSGTFDNTEHTIYASEDYLMCTHSGTNYTGTYTSEVFDTGVVSDDYYMYLNADIVVTGGGTSWNDITASGTLTGDEIGITTKSWNEIFEVDEAPKVNIIIYYKEVSGDAWSEVRNAEILSSVVNARYFKVYINIEDPSSGIYAKVEHFDLKLYTQT